MKKNIAMHKTTFLLFALLLCTGLYGQARDTIYIHEERIVYDTVYLHDTIYQFVATQPDTPIVSKPAAKYVPDVFKGFHFGYTVQYNMTQAAVFTAADGTPGSPTTNRGSGFAGGFEFSYHFAKYFGVAVGVGLVRRFVPEEGAAKDRQIRDQIGEAVDAVRQQGVALPEEAEDGLKRR